MDFVEGASEYAPGSLRDYVGPGSLERPKGPRDAGFHEAIQ
jgi:hypothetical protein